MAKRRKPMKVGDLFETRSFGKVKVIEVYSDDHAMVEFEDGCQDRFWRTAIVKGYIKNYMKPIVLGVGFLGQGTEKLSRCRAYGIWVQMLERCYTEKYPAYIGCSVCKDWLNFSNFKLWYESMPGSSTEGFQLDKDILVKGNRLYSPTTCILVPGNLNKLLESSRAARGNLPLGVSLHSQTLKYTARCCDSEGNYPHLGLFSTPEIAFSVYKEFKENVIKQSAEKYRSILSSEAYDSLMAWEIEYDE